MGTKAPGVGGSERTEGGKEGGRGQEKRRKKEGGEGREDGRVRVGGTCTCICSRDDCALESLTTT